LFQIAFVTMDFTTILRSPKYQLGTVFLVMKIDALPVHRRISNVTLARELIETPQIFANACKDFTIFSIILM
jgi:hypothetical protein